MKDNENIIPKKITLQNYIIIAVISIITIAITLYVCKWINISRIDKLSTSPLANKVSELYLSELEESIKENGEVILYFGYTSDEDVYSLEEKMLKTIIKDDLNEFVYYINVTDYLENDKYKEYIYKCFPELKDKKLTAPLFIYVKKAEALKMVSSNKKLVTIKDFVNLTGLLETE